MDVYISITEVEALSWLLWKCGPTKEVKVDKSNTVKEEQTGVLFVPLAPHVH